jgi:hypothetical protein
MKWHRLRGFSPSPTAYIVCVYYIRCIFDFPAHRKEAGRFWHCSKEDMRPLHLFSKISFLQKPFVEELAEKWLFCPNLLMIMWLPHMVHRRVWNIPLHVHSRLCLKYDTFGPESAAWPSVGWGEMAWVAILFPPSPHQGILFLFLFCFVLWSYMISGSCYWC